MNGRSAYSVRIEGAKYGVGFGSALAIATFVARPVDAVATIACGLAGGGALGSLRQGELTN